MSIDHEVSNISIHSSSDNGYLKFVNSRSRLLIQDLRPVDLAYSDGTAESSQADFTNPGGIALVPNKLS